MSNYYIISILLPFILTFLVLPPIRNLALRTGFLDMPSERKLHSLPVPLGGGLGIFISFVSVFIIFNLIMDTGDTSISRGMIAGSVLIFLVGLYDDLYEMAPMEKFLGQCISALIFLAFVEKFPPAISSLAYFVFGMVWMVSIQNAINFLDNMDGLCAGVSISIAMGLGILFIFKDMPFYAILSFALAGGTMAFIRYNLPPASIFLGDAGSLFLGFTLSCLGIIHISTSKDMASALAPFIIMAYPIFDLIFVTLGRLNEGRKVYIGGMDHTSHKITYMGLSRNTTIFIIHFINLLLVIFGIAIYFMAESPFQTLSIAVLAFILAFAGAHLYKNILYLKYKIYLILIDICAINITFFCYILIRYGVLSLPTLIQITELMAPLAWINVFWIIIYSAGGLYDLAFELRFREQIIILFRMAAFGIIAFSLATFKSGQGIQVSLASLLFFGALLMAFNSLVRYIYHRILDIRAISPDGQMAAIIVRLKHSIDNDNYQMYRNMYTVRGYSGEKSNSNFEYLGPLENLTEILRESRVARVILDLQQKFNSNLLPIFESAFYMETRFLVSNPNLYDLRGLKITPTKYEGIYILSPGRRRIYARLLNRLFDFIVAGITFLGLAPWFLTRLFFAWLRQFRIIEKIPVIGRGEEEVELPCLISEKSSHRFRNPLGLLAVLKGKLSLVGPTITLKSETDGEPWESIPAKWRKFQIRPGLLGPGYRGSTIQEKFDLDLSYIEKASIFYDIAFLIGYIFQKSSIKDSESARPKIH